VHLQAARLLQLHIETSPKAIGAYLGVTPDYVRRLWARYTLEELRQIPEDEALQILATMRQRS